VHDVGGEERQVKQYEHGKENTEDAHGTSTAVNALHRRARSPTILPRLGWEAAGTLRLRQDEVGAVVTAISAAMGERIDRQRRVTDGRRE